MFADSFSVLSVHCVARGLGASFLYKWPASPGGSLRQHSLLVYLDLGNVYRTSVSMEDVKEET